MKLPGSGLLHDWFAHPAVLALLALLPLLGVMAFLARRRRRRVLLRLGYLPVLQVLGRRRLGFALVSGTSLSLALVLLVAGMAGPQWGRDWSKSTAYGRDLVLVLDLSRSMLAQDVLPSRAERARQALADLIGAVEERGGYRLGLVAFAGRAKIVCPLTHDYDHVRMALATLDAADLPPDLEPRGDDALSGTRIGAALQAAVLTHDPRYRGYQDILLISDGDDPAADEEWRDGAEFTRRHGIPVHTVALGNPAASSPIPLGGHTLLRYKNQPVLTRMHEKPLSEIAQLTGGTFVLAGTEALHLGALFRERIEPQMAHEEQEDILPVMQQHADWFLGGALSLLSFQLMFGPIRFWKPWRKEAAAA